jgi:hypothetical protein
VKEAGKFTLKLESSRPSLKLESKRQVVLKGPCRTSVSSGACKRAGGFPEEPQQPRPSNYLIPQTSSLLCPRYPLLIFPLTTFLLPKNASKAGIVSQHVFTCLSGPRQPNWCCGTSSSVPPPTHADSANPHFMYCTSNSKSLIESATTS